MELWDVYDENRKPKGFTHVRGIPMKDGDFHMVVLVWVVNEEGKLLLMRRSPEKESFPNQWAATGGSALAGEGSLEAMQRELREETGIHAEQSEFRLLHTFVVPEHHYFTDVYVLHKTVPLEDIVFQPGETCDAMWATEEELEALAAGGDFVTTDLERFRFLHKMF